MTAARALSDSELLVASWRKGVLSLPDDRVPCPGLIWIEPGPRGRHGVWAGVRTMMLRFCEHWAEEAVALGWTTERLFGVHRLAGALRADSTGALVSIYPRKVVAIDERRIVTERGPSRLTSHGPTNPADCIPIWEWRRT